MAPRLHQVGVCTTPTMVTNVSIFDNYFIQTFIQKKFKCSYICIYKYPFLTLIPIGKQNSLLYYILVKRYVENS